MSRIDFAFGAEDRLRMACQTAARHAGAGRRLLVYCTDARRMRRFDALLWSFEPASFITHALIGEPLAAEAAVLLAADTQALDEAAHDGWLLNLDLECPPGAARFERILEIVSGHDADIAAARRRWQAYKAAGHELHAHDLAAGNPDGSA
uniref:DNA polymerase III subunit chi n=1 Tax=Castellaniella defragrans TaxID=75697 RepID=UPI00333E44FE